MTAVHATAPGKLFVLGEYAVLDSCPAIIAALEPGVRVLAEPQTHPRGTWVSLPQYGVHTALEELSAPAPIGNALRFVTACFAGLSAAERFRLPTGLHLQIEFPEYFGRPQKVGLGGSAALVTAISAVLIEMAYGRGATEEMTDLVYQRAVTAHRRAQGGRGSGGDVAASVYGGAILFEPEAEDVGITHLKWPEHLRLIVGWSGRSASTSALIEAYERAKQTHPTVHQQFLDDSIQAVANFASALHGSGNALHIWAQAAEVLPAFAARARLPYLTTELETLLTAAKQAGSAAKPSGAGGGDCAIALSTHEAAAQVAQAWQHLGFPALVAAPSAEGVYCAQA
ncbi:MAG: hypothetical protein N3C12_05975 [Candidatus Binatia bacterium]|nr:hypothetical protein [Candidatus Binatia bacterium]